MALGLVLAVRKNRMQCTNQLPFSQHTAFYVSQWTSTTPFEVGRCRIPEAQALSSDCTCGLTNLDYGMMHVGDNCSDGTRGFGTRCSILTQVLELEINSGHANSTERI